MQDKPVDLHDLLRRFLAVDVVNGSVLRNQERGVVGAIQKELAEVDIGNVPSGSITEYKAWLDKKTSMILDALKVKNRPWGTVRKALNLFMRACICNVYLRKQCDLQKIEALAEIPLDGIVANALKRQAGRGILPTWPYLKNLKSMDNDYFQGFALKHAKERGLPARVYLDNLLWLENRKRK